MKHFTVEFFDLKNNWWDQTTIQADTAEKAKDLVRAMMGRGFVHFRVFAA